MRLPLIPIVALAFSITLGCGSPDDDVQNDPQPAPSNTAAQSANRPAVGNKPEDRSGIHHLMRLTDRIYSGSEPHGEDGFAELERLGVKTVVSVDGAKPQVDLAKKLGIRYVHIPIGYDGVPEESGQALARLTREIEGPVYIHCHHGKHRGPAAAAVACIASGKVDAKGAVQILERAGTSKDYQGLWRDVENYTPPAADAELPELVETAEVSSFAAAMAQVDRAYDNLKLCRDANWGVPPDHPDLVPAQEALLVQEGLHESGRNLKEGASAELKQWLVESEQQAKDLRTVLMEGDATAAGERFTVLEQSCKQCHKKYRNRVVGSSAKRNPVSRSFFRDQPDYGLLLSSHMWSRNQKPGFCNSN